MRIRSIKSCAFVWIVAYALLGGSLAVAESSQTSSVVNFEVLSVDGNRVVIRDQNGTREITVPDNFKFTVDGKSMSVNQLAAGMKGTATVTTTTTVRPVYVTEIRKGTVLRQSAQTLIVRGQDGTRRFTQDDADAAGMEIFMDGKPVKVWQLRAGDEFTALIVSSAAPEVLTEKEVAATLAAPEPEPVAMAAPRGNARTGTCAGTDSHAGPGAGGCGPCCVGSSCGSSDAGGAQGRFALVALGADSGRHRGRGVRADAQRRQ